MSEKQNEKRETTGNENEKGGGMGSTKKIRPALEENTTI